jgi:hypothetical protein
VIQPGDRVCLEGNKQRQAEAIVDWVSLVDIPSDQVHFFVNTGKPFCFVPLFTRDPAAINETQILTAMLAISRSTQQRSAYLGRKIESGSGEARPSLRRKRLAEGA